MDQENKHKEETVIHVRHPSARPTSCLAYFWLEHAVPDHNKPPLLFIIFILLLFIYLFDVKPCPATLPYTNLDKAPCSLLHGTRSSSRLRHGCTRKEEENQKTQDKNHVGQLLRSEPCGQQDESPRPLVFYFVVAESMARVLVRQQLLVHGNRRLEASTPPAIGCRIVLSRRCCVAFTQSRCIHSIRLARLASQRNRPIHPERWMQVTCQIAHREPS